MSDTLIGVIIGSLISTIGSTIQYLASWYQQSKEWDRRQREETEKWERLKQKDEMTIVREAYRTAVGALVTLADDDAKQDGTENRLAQTDRIRLTQEASSACGILCLRYPRSSLCRRLNDYSYKFSATRLLELVFDCMRHELLFDNPAITESPRRARDARTISFRNSKQLCEMQFLQGELIGERESIDVRLSELTESQRQILLQHYGMDHLKGNSSLTLEIPRTRGSRTSTVWELNTVTKNPKMIMEAWECDYNSAAEKESDDAPKNH